jgi:FkbM family methyltransferase
VGPGEVAIDVGTNIGEVLLNFARQVGPQGQVFGMEINPRTYQRCLRNIALNPFRNVELCDVGLGRQEGELFLSRPDQRNSGADRVVSDPASQGTRVKLTTLDKFVKERGLARLDVVKIDVEGFEMNVLQGAEASLRRFHPRLFIELDDGNLRQQGSSAQELVGWLMGLGYALVHAGQGTPVLAGQSFEGCHFDIIGRAAAS